VVRDFAGSHEKIQVKKSSGLYFYRVMTLIINHIYKRAVGPKDKFSLARKKNNIEKNGYFLKQPNSICPTFFQ